MNTIDLSSPATRVLIARIDALMQELEEMRQLVLAQSQPSSARDAEDIVTRLSGILAPPMPRTHSAIEEYTAFLEWERFANG
ncbi:MAG: hypothetical protein ACLFTI_05305 [Anaerolineales bacterium]